MGYNFSTNNYYTPSTNWEETSYASHNAGSQMNLWEGNQFEGTAYCDNTWGTSNLVTYFRNQFKGRGYNENSSATSGNLTTTDTHAIAVQQGCRGFNLIGNVLGTAGYSTTYQTNPGAASGCDNDVYNLGFGATECRTASNIPNDPLVASSLMRCGNYDTATNAVRWNSAECEPAAVGSGATAIGSSLRVDGHDKTHRVSRQPTSFDGRIVGFHERSQRTRPSRPGFNRSAGSF